MIYNKFAEIYDKYYSDDFYEEYYKFIINSIKNNNINKLLDVACGTGLLLDKFSKDNIYKTGFDLSDTMVKIAKDKNLNVYKDDMTCYKVDELFSIITNTFDSLNYIETLKKIEDSFKCTIDALEINGFFIFDMITPYQINYRASKFGTKYNKMDSYEIINLNRTKKNMWINEIIIFEKTRNAAYKKYIEKHISYSYELKDIMLTLQNTGFKNIKVYKSLKLEDIDSETKRWFFVCNK